MTDPKVAAAAVKANIENPRKKMRAAIKAAKESGMYKGMSKKELKKEYVKSISKTPYTEEEAGGIEGWQQK
jgi:hypothetical protein